jgi:hypothetical protein
MLWHVLLAYSVRHGRTRKSPFPSVGKAAWWAAIAASLTRRRWYRLAAIYCLDVGLFQDSDGDGVGDLRGLIDRLDYVPLTGRPPRPLAVRLRLPPNPP